MFILIFLYCLLCFVQRTSLGLNFLTFSLPFVCAQRGPPDHTLDDSFRYTTRPDIEAPKWAITIHDKDHVTPGYWFVEPYDYLDQALVNGGKWNAPMIFDGDGELIWSGAYLSQQYNSFDFRINRVLGEDMLTFLYMPNKTAILMDTHFKIRKIFQTSAVEGELENMHELQFVNDGTRALYFYDETKNVTASQSEAIGFTEWNCPIRENGIRERDLTTDEILFSWASSDHIDLTESTSTERSVEDRCTNVLKGWDYIHTNSLDKFPDGSGYLMSGRHTDAIYKIGPDGSIVWRLGGSKCDFEVDFKFARQHHARILEHNVTHTIMSFFDNAKAENAEEGAAPYSRGLIVVLHTSANPMTATVLHEYPHPDGEGAYTLGRASIQVLPNNNVFTCWVDGCLHSEHTADGKLVMEARVKQRWLKTYRSYKFPFVGLPTRPPDIHAETQTAEGPPRTIVYVSWNGATEVAEWLLYKSDQSGNRWEHLASLPRTQFETAFEYDGYAKYVFVEGLDRNAESLGKSDVFETLMSSPLSAETIAQEEQWLQQQDGQETSWTVEAKAKAKAAADNAAAKAIFWILCAIVTVLVGRTACRGRRKWMRWWPGKLNSYEMHQMTANGEHEAFLADHEEDDIK